MASYFGRNRRFVELTMNARTSGYGLKDSVTGFGGEKFVEKIYLLFSHGKINTPSCVVRCDGSVGTIRVPSVQPSESRMTLTQVLDHFIELHGNMYEWTKRQQENRLPFDLQKVRPVALREGKQKYWEYELYLNIPLEPAAGESLEESLRVFRPGVHPAVHFLTLFHDIYFAYRAWEGRDWPDPSAKPKMSLLKRNSDVRIFFDLERAGWLFQCELWEILEGFVNKVDSRLQKNFPQDPRFMIKGG